MAFTGAPIRERPGGRVLLLFPPFVLPWSPYLGPPLLKAYLQQYGVKVDQLDLSLTFFEQVVGREYLEESESLLARRYEAANALPSIGRADAYRLLAEVRGRTDARYAARHVGEAKAILRDPHAFYVPERYEWAIQVLSRALAAISSRWFPGELTTEGFRTAYSPFSVREGIAFLRDREQNLFGPFYERWLLPDLRLEDYSVVGISVAFPDQILAAWSLADRLRARRPDVFVVLGGNVLSRTGDTLVDHGEIFDLVDAVVVGEGERPLVEIVEARAQGREIHGIPGVVSRWRGRVGYTPATASVRARDLPTPDFGGLDLGAYLSPHPVLPLLTFKGCSYGKCTFCDHHVNYSVVSGRPGAKVAADVRLLHRKHGASRFTFVDEEMPPAHARNVAGALLADGMPTVRWMGYAIYRKSWHREHWEELHRSGCREILFGFESASPRVLERMRKPLSLDWVRRITRDLNHVGIASRTNVIVGYPGETVEEAEQTLEFFLAERELFAVPGTLVAVHPFLMVRNAPLLRTATGLRIVQRPAGQPLRLHFDYDLSRAQELEDEAGGGTLLDQEKAYRLAAEHSRRIATSYGPTHDPLWRVHRFLYSVQRDLRPLPVLPPPEAIPGRAADNGPPANPIPLSLEHVGTVVTDFDLVALQAEVAALEARCDNARFWANHRSQGAAVHRRLEEENAPLKPRQRQVALHLLLLGESGTLVDRLVPYDTATDP